MDIRRSDDVFRDSGHEAAEAASRTLRGQPLAGDAEKMANFVVDCLDWIGQPTSQAQRIEELESELWHLRASGNDA